MKKKLKINFGEGGPKGAIKRHVEKIVFAAVAIVSLLIIWSGLGHTPIDSSHSKEQLLTAASDAQKILNDNKWDKQEPELLPPKNSYAENYVKRVNDAKDPVDERNYPAPVLLDKQIFPLKLQRADPTLLAVEQLEVRAGFGGLSVPVDAREVDQFVAEENMSDPAENFAMTEQQSAFFARQGRGGGKTSKVEGKYFVSILGLIPVKLQREKFVESLGSALGYQGGNTGRDTPQYGGFRLERVELPADGSDPDWNNKIEIDSRTIAESSKGWISKEEEIADARYVNMEGLLVEGENTVQIVGKVPDILMRDMTLYSLHSAVPRQPEEAKLGPGRVYDDKPQGDLAVEEQVDYRLFRAFDFNVERGKSYQYRVILSLVDPNHPRERSEEPAEHCLDDSVAARIAAVRAEEQKLGSGKRIFLVDTPPSDPSSVTISAPSRVLAGSVAEGRTIPREFYTNVMAIVWDNKWATDIPGSMYDAYAGSLIDFKNHAIFYDANANRLGRLRDYQYRTGTTVLDIRGGQPSSKGAVVAPNELLLLDSGGELIVRRQLDDFDEFTLNTFSEKPKEEKEGPK